MSVVTLYDKQDFKAGKKVVTINGPIAYSTLTNLDGVNLKNDIGSLKVASGYKLTLYDNENYQGKKVEVTGPSNIANTGDIGMKNKANSLIVSRTGTIAPNVNNGDIIRCDRTGAIYKIENNQKRPFTSIEIYQSYGSPTWKSIECALIDAIPTGPAMTMAPPSNLPSGIRNGDVIKTSDGAVFLIENDQKRWYPNAAIYQSWGSPQPKYVDDNTARRIPNGPDMQLKPNNLPPTPPPGTTTPIPGSSGPVVATVYDKPNYTGNSMVLRKGDSYNDLSTTPIGNNKIKSAKVSPGYTLILYQDKNKAGKALRLVGPTQIPRMPESPDKFEGRISGLEIRGNGISGVPNDITIVGQIKQTNQDGPRYDNAGGGCPYGDWRIKDKLCGILDSTVCPDGGLVKAEWTNQSSGEKSDFNLVSCTYNAGILTTDNIKQIQSKQWENSTVVEQRLDSDILPYFCGQKVTTCPVDPDTQNPMPGCSRFVSTAADGDICRTWAINSRKSNPGNADATMIKYCNANNTPDCKCLNRDRDPFYQQFISGTPDSTSKLDLVGYPNCWWKACQARDNLSNTLVTSDLAQPCRVQVCAQFNTISQGQKSAINQNEFNQNISCDFPPSGPIKEISGLPVGIQNGDIVKCNVTGEIYRIENNMKRIYPPTVSPIVSVNLDNCSALGQIPDGSPMPADEPPTPPSPGESTPDTPPRPIEPDSPPEEVGRPWWFWGLIGLAILILLVIIGVGIYFATRRK
jgi:hypothetical protein